jgi:hypothetical protein
MATAITTTGGIKLNALGESIRGSLQKTPGDWFGYTTINQFVALVYRLISLGLKQIVACEAFVVICYSLHPCRCWTLVAFTHSSVDATSHIDCVVSR